MKRKAHFQRTLAAQTSFEKYVRKSKRGQFLDAMNKVVPWSRLLALVEPHYPKAGNGRRPVGLEVMLRSYLLNQVLKKDWGFKGWVMSDWGATHSAVRAALNGLDQEMPVAVYFADQLKSAI